MSAGNIQSVNKRISVISLSCKNMQAIAAYHLSLVVESALLQKRINNNDQPLSAFNKVDNSSTSPKIFKQQKALFKSFATICGTRTPDADQKNSSIRHKGTQSSFSDGASISINKIIIQLDSCITTETCIAC